MNYFKTPYRTIQQTAGCGISLFAVLGCNLIAGIEDAEVDPTFMPDEVPDVSEPLGDGLELSSDSCSTDLAVDESVIRSCVYRISCDPRALEFSISDCVTNNLQTALTGEACAIGATTCDEVEECIKVERLDEEDLNLCSGDQDRICSSDEAVQCGDDPYKVNCPELNATCEESRLAPAITQCSPAMPMDCQLLEDGGSYCDGDTNIFWCIDGIAQGYDCGAVGKRCVEYEEAEATCSPRISECDDPGQIGCEGNSVVDCDENEHSLKYNCAASGLVCDAQGSDDAHCVAEGCEETTDCQESCLDETTAQICVGGATVNVDCTKFTAEVCQERRLATGSMAVACGTLLP